MFVVRPADFFCPKIICGTLSALKFSLAIFAFRAFEFIVPKHYPKHLLRQNYPSKGNIYRGKIIPQREDFPSEGQFSLEISFPFPSKWPVFPWNEGFEKMEFLWLVGENLWLSPARENLPQAIFLPQKILWVLSLGKNGQEESRRLHLRRF